jgi:hypothetical protein
MPDTSRAGHGGIMDRGYAGAIPFSLVITYPVWVDTAVDVIEGPGNCVADAEPRAIFHRNPGMQQARGFDDCE